MCTATFTVALSQQLSDHRVDLGDALQETMEDEAYCRFVFNNLCIALVQSSVWDEYEVAGCNYNALIIFSLQALTAQQQNLHRQIQELPEALKKLQEQIEPNSMKASKSTTISLNSWTLSVCAASVCAVSCIAAFALARLAK